MKVSKTLLAMAGIADTEVGRYDLGGIQLWTVAGGKTNMAAATNGRALIVAAWPNDDPTRTENFYIDQQLIALATSIPHVDDVLTVGMGAAPVTTVVKMPGRELLSLLHTSKELPKLPRVSEIPWNALNDTDAYSVKLSPTRLEEVVTALANMIPIGNEVVMTVSSNPEHGVVFTARLGGSVTVAAQLLPIATDYQKPPKPVWNPETLNKKG